MGLRSCVVVIGLFVLFFLAGVVGSMAGARQDANNPQQPLMTPVSVPSGFEILEATGVSRKTLVERLRFRAYEAAMGDLSLCAGDKRCLKYARRIKSWFCAAGVCDGTDKSRNPIDCFGGGFGKYSKGVQDQINSSLCDLIKSPDTVTRQALLGHIPDPKAQEDDLVEYGAYLLALKGSSISCENYIKDYVGAYGPQWTYRWYRALSGCRILARQRTRQQEEKDFYTWFGVVLRGLGNCSNIINSEMRQACNAPAASPIPVYVQ